MRNYLLKLTKAFSESNRSKNSAVHEAWRKISKPLKSMAIQSETFTSLIEFVKNHLVKIEFLCHYQTPYLRYLNSAKILSYLNWISTYVSDKANLKQILLQQIKQLLHPLIQYTYNSITNDSWSANYSYFKNKKEKTRKN